ncbi:PPOX class F420-dependent oxidoreductase [Streptomyces tsukubensis]|uniref:PPOX class F420-dependent enzyme n=1 Tax=Streptomyces tsukubensis TaxID=83656 RepID=A0A1V4AEP4_9ACTN|nr:PPOX class F420-dependent oxidoreductase [Streptomyces tsukubensis]OON81959.1 PPOX class F420-dependent enzyme [Streptomyces tsukubensis]QFR98140.1 TIGR03618 family F420-dependent PPOX class oxidoreductase [Streptomyces tsukubensis]
MSFLTDRHLGVLTTMKSNGRPQLSNVSYACDTETRTIRISTTADRAKTHNLRRDPRSGLYVTTPEGDSYAVYEGTADLSTVAATPDDPTVEELISLYRDVQGEHPDWDEYRAAMVKDRRLVIRLRVEYAYGWVR